MFDPPPPLRNQLGGWKGGRGLGAVAPVPILIISISI